MVVLIVLTETLLKDAEKKKKLKKGENVVAYTPATQRSCVGLPSADDK